LQISFAENGEEMGEGGGGSGQVSFLLCPAATGPPFFLSPSTKLLFALSQRLLMLMTGVEAQVFWHLSLLTTESTVNV
jgi:hypothetical protein